MGPSRRPRSQRAGRRCTEPFGWRRGLLLLGAAAVAAGGCLAATTAGNEAARAWAEGPARWLLLPDERAALHRVTTSGELTAFLQEFWRRRDDDPDTPEVPLARLYAQRVADADRLYAEEGVRGSLTDRGGALLLLGPPSLMSFSVRQVPAWESRRTPGPRPTRPVRLEVWTYQPRDLPPALRELRAGGKAANGKVTLTFLLGSRSTRLIEGREIFAQAACAWARCAEPVH
jgi:GWxTD domain-containing protein